MSELIKRVAEAISLGEWSDSEHWECRADREVWIERARAAIEAMREPTNKMEEAGNLALSGNGVENVESNDSTVCFQAMIDTALKPSE